MHLVVVISNSLLLSCRLSSIANTGGMYKAGSRLCLMQKRHWGPYFVMFATMLFSPIHGQAYILFKLLLSLMFL